MQDQDTQTPAETQAPLRSEVDLAFDEWYRTLYVQPYGKSGVRDSFKAGFAAARGEQPVPQAPPAAPRPVYPLRKRA